MPSRGLAGLDALEDKMDLASWKAGDAVGGVDKAAGPEGARLDIAAGLEGERGVAGDARFGDSGLVERPGTLRFALLTGSERLPDEFEPCNWGSATCRLSLLASMSVLSISEPLLPAPMPVLSGLTLNCTPV